MATGSKSKKRITPVWMDVKKIKHVTIHCTATPEGRHHSAAEISKWDIDKFRQESYHWVVELDGTAVQTLKDNQVGAHVGGHNTGNIGIAYVGGMDKEMKNPKDTRTPAQKATIIRLVDSYKKKYPGVKARGHNEWPGVNKACPSFSVKAEFPN
jgi:N-acetylmuramoyl-L-alanine amidase